MSRSHSRHVAHYNHLANVLNRRITKDMCDYFGYEKDYYNSHPLLLVHGNHHGLHVMVMINANSSTTFHITYNDFLANYGPSDTRDANAWYRLLLVGLVDDLFAFDGTGSLYGWVFSAKSRMNLHDTVLTTLSYAINILLALNDRSQTRIGVLESPLLDSDDIMTLALDGFDNFDITDDQLNRSLMVKLHNFSVTVKYFEGLMLDAGSGLSAIKTNEYMDVNLSNLSSSVRTTMDDIYDSDTDAKFLKGVLYYLGISAVMRTMGYNFEWYGFSQRPDINNDKMLESDKHYQDMSQVLAEAFIYADKQMLVQMNKPLSSNYHTKWLASLKSRK